MDPALTSALTALAAAATAALGAIINSAVAKYTQQSKDFSAALEKLRILEAKVGIEPDCEPRTINDIFVRIRKIEAKLDSTKTP